MLVNHEHATHVCFVTFNMWDVVFFPFCFCVELNIYFQLWVFLGVCGETIGFCNLLFIRNVCQIMRKNMTYGTSTNGSNMPILLV